MRYYQIIFLVTVATINLFSCQSKTNVKNHDNAHELFMKSMYLTEAYIDSIEHAPDSTALNQFIERFNNKITVINYQFPPDTDLDLSEEENDSLIRMFKRLDSSITKRRQMLNNQNSMDSLLTNSAESLLANDSVQK